ncbi:MAG TPA: hypothetical protein VEA38_12110 [Terriglobales bacterium]|nr:hypothetical protein [Terriglobales bacterium]
MTTRAADTIWRQPARLVKNPTSFAGSFPYGGTELGATRGAEVEFFGADVPIPAEEWNGAPSETLEGADWCMAFALLRSYDNDAIAAIHRNTSTGSSSGKKVAAGSAAGTVRAGHVGSDRALKLLIVPENTTEHEAIYIPLAKPIIVGGSRVAWTIGRERAVEVSFLSLPDATGRFYVMGRLPDLTV